MKLQTDSTTRLYAKVGRTIAKSQYYAAPVSAKETEERVEEEL